MFICQDCFRDEELRSEVASNATQEGRCEVCGTEGKVMDLAEFYGFFDALLALFAPTDREGSPVAQLIQDDWKIFKDLETARVLLNEVMTTRGWGFSMDTPVDYTPEIQERVAVWERLKQSVKGNSRFFTNMDEFAQYNYLTAGRSLHTGHTLYRARITPDGQEAIPRMEMGCPPQRLASAGRANPIGIPYLYLSEQPKTTYFEVRAVYLDRLSVGTFQVVRDLALVDFVYDINLYVAYNEAALPLKEVVIKKKVIDEISQDLSKPLRRYDSELEYVPTQLICEYCKRVVGADGVSFDSSLHKGGRNYVLFDGSAAQCVQVDIHEITQIDIDRN